MPAHSRPKDGVLSHAYGAGIHVLKSSNNKDVDGIGSRACPTSALITCRKSGRPDLQ